MFTPRKLYTLAAVEAFERILHNPSAHDMRLKLADECAKIANAVPDIFPRKDMRSRFYNALAIVTNKTLHGLVTEEHVDRALIALCVIVSHPKAPSPGLPELAKRLSPTTIAHIVAKATNPFTTEANPPHTTAGVNIEFALFQLLTGIYALDEKPFRRSHLRDALVLGLSMRSENDRAAVHVLVKRNDPDLWKLLMSRAAKPAVSGGSMMAPPMLG